MRKKEIDVIRRNIQTCKGEKVRLTSKGGRKRVIVHEGTIGEIYDNVFVLECKKSGETNRKVTFSYTDILTKAVDFTLYKNDQKLKLTF